MAPHNVFIVFLGFLLSLNLILVSKYFSIVFVSQGTRDQGPKLQCLLKVIRKTLVMYCSFRMRK